MLKIWYTYNTVSINVKLYSYYKEFGGPQKIKNKLPYNPAISLLGIYPKVLKLGS